MKKVISFLLAATMALSLAACGNSGSGGSGDAITIDLSAFYTEMYDSIFPDPDNAPALSEITGDYLEQTYPGLSEVETKQCLAYAPMITAVAYEIALVEVANADDVAKVVVEEGIKVVTTGAGNPEKYMDMWKSAGIKVIPVVASVALARRMEKYGADALVAEGTESGGHIGEQTTMTLVPQVVDAVSIPVIAAGGIGDGRGIAAAFMLGAEAVQMGTRFVVAKESIVHANYKQRVIKAKDIDSTVTGRSHGHPVRCLRNQMTREYQKLEAEGKSFEELEYLTLGTLRKAVQEGDVTNGTVMAGQIAGMISKEQTCKEMIDEMMEQAGKLLHWS